MKSPLRVAGLLDAAPLLMAAVAGFGGFAIEMGFIMADNHAVGIFTVGPLQANQVLPC